jgi:hypothetical protein
MSSMFQRLLGRTDRAAKAGGLAGDARSMRATLEGIHHELAIARGPRTEVDIRTALRDLLDGEVAAPTDDVTALKARGTDADAFYAAEVAPSWEGLNEAQRAARVEGFLEMCSMLAQAGDMPGVPAEMGAVVRTKALVLAWAFDETYGYLSRLARDA